MCGCYIIWILIFYCIHRLCNRADGAAGIWEIGSLVPPWAMSEKKALFPCKRPALVLLLIFIKLTNFFTPAIYIGLVSWGGCHTVAKFLKKAFTLLELIVMCMFVSAEFSSGPYFWKWKGIRCSALSTNLELHFYVSNPTGLTHFML